MSNILTVEWVVGLLCAWSGTVAAFRALDAATAGQDRSRIAAAILQNALPPGLEVDRWSVAFDVRLLRLGRRIDAVIATGEAVVAIQVRPGASSFHAADRLAAENAALDLADFHAGSHGLPVIPVVLVPNGARVRQQFPLPLAGAAQAVEASRLTLPGLLRQIASFPSAERAAGRAGVAWAEGGYAPVPGLIDAACRLYAGHGDDDLRRASAGPDAVRRAMAAVSAAVADAQVSGQKLVVFVTGAPGAGKTFCGLDFAFAPGPAAFLTGNPTLVHVLRAALVRDALGRGIERRAAERRVAAVIQALPQFRDHYVGRRDSPAEAVLVIDEAQRCWSRDHAVRRTRTRPAPLQDSEPGHLLDIMARRPGWAALLCLVGGGQEIHDGEGGLAAWGEALAARPEWRVWAPEVAMRAKDLRQRLPELANLERSADLHLEAPIRAVRAPATASWVEALLADAPEQAAELARAAGGVPFAVTRSLDTLRLDLRQRGTRSSGLLASSTARRLRAEGLGAVLAHQDDDAVARWFLDRWPDIRSGDALEVAGTEFAVQGLELRHHVAAATRTKRQPAGLATTCIAPLRSERMDGGGVLFE